MRKPAEHGNVISSIVLGVTSVLNGIILGRNYYSVIFWAPIWAGLFLYDVPISRLLRERENIIVVFIIGISAIISVILNLWLLIPYALFFIVYSLRIYLVKRRANFVGVALGLLGYALLFSSSWLKPGKELLIITITLFVFLLGSEFLVRSVVRKKRYLSFYNFITLTFVLFNPIFLLYSISLVRIISAYTINRIKTIGIIESTLLVLSMIMLEAFIVLR